MGKVKMVLNTNSKNIKTWALAIPCLTESDILWLKGLGVGVKTEPLTNKVYIQGCMVNEVVIGHKIEVTTSSKKQESMLYLKYGEDLKSLWQ